MREKQPGTALGILMLAAAFPIPVGAQQNAPSATVEIDDNDIGGVVTGRAKFVRPEYELGCDIGERRSREFCFAL